MVLKKHKFRYQTQLRQNYKYKELQYSLAKAAYSDLRLPVLFRFFFYKYYISERMASICKIKRICLRSGRFKSVHSFLREYRMFVREQLSSARFSGIRKASW